MHAQPAVRTLRLACRLSAYQGAVRARVLTDKRSTEPAAPAGPPGAEWVAADRNSIRNSPLAAVLSC